MGQADVSFHVTAADAATIRKIVRRAEKLITGYGGNVDRLSLNMDITATHANGCPLRLEDLLAADNFNFLHDVTKIERFLNRDTGKLGDHFLPRFRARAEKVAAS